MLFKDISDCEECPFIEGGEYSDLCDHSGNLDMYHPCESRDKWGNMTTDEVAGEIYRQQAAYEERIEKQWEKEEAERSKKKEKAKKSAEARWVVRSEQIQINNLRKRLKNNLGIIRFNDSMRQAMSIVNNMLEGTSTDTAMKSKHPLEEVNEQIKNGDTENRGN